MEAWLEPIDDAETMRAADSWAIEELGIPSLELMERAGLALAEAAEEVCGEGPVRVVCGKGNNGGDGLVAARHLTSFGHPVEVLLLWPAAELSADSAANLERFDGEVRELGGEDPAEALAGAGVVVDAIFGTGFASAPREPALTAIEAINAAGAAVVAADIPSGVNASNGEVEGVAVEADLTVSFHAPKLGQIVAPGKWCCGELRVAEIGIPPGAPGEAPAGAIGPGVLEQLPRRDRHSTKFSSGEVLIAGGSRGLTGAVCLAAEAAIRSGAGYATVAVPAELEPIFEIKLTEVMSRACPSAAGSFAPEADEAIVGAAKRAAAVVLGGGLGRAESAAALVASVSAQIEAPLVIDADGLNAISANLEVISERARATVLTPHAGELARLLGTESAQVDARRLAHARELVERSGAVVVLKGDDTIVAAPDGRLAVNALPSPALATAGTGDVLSGVIGALLARGLEPFAAACAAVHVHAVAGMLAAQFVGVSESVIAGDVIEALPAAFAGDDAVEDAGEHEH